MMQTSQKKTGKTGDKVSILIPTHNRERFVLGAVRSALNQSYRDIEVIVGINGCTDNTEKLVTAIDDPRLRIEIRRDLKSMYENFNLLVDEAIGDYILILSDDDELHPDAISNLQSARQSHNAHMAVGAVKVFLHGVNKTPPSFNLMEKEVDWATLVYKYFDLQLSIYPCATLLPRKELIALGSYDYSKYSFAADTAVWILLAERLGKVALCNKVVANYMIHDGNETIISSYEKWQSALNGIREVINKLPYASVRQKSEIQQSYYWYRAYVTARGQSDALGRAGLTINRLIVSGRIIFQESVQLPLVKRVKLFLLWFARSCRQALRARITLKKN
jgi:glycosyltransferase involved in cell wall biosynthesis